MHTARSEDVKPYISDQPLQLWQRTRAEQDTLIQEALNILKSRLAMRSAPYDSPQSVKDYCRLMLGGLEHEEFGVMFLDPKYCMIKFDVMFRGTITQTAVYPREVVKMALKLNASAVIFTHNHPSGQVEPSRADEMLTQTLKSALRLVDVTVLDHIVVSANGTTSFAERGLM